MGSEMQDLAEKRDELDVTLSTVASYLTDHHSLAESTLSTRLSEWERGDTIPSDDDISALSSALDEIEEEQNFEYDECVVCGRTPQLDIDYIDGEPHCIICTYSED